MYLIYEQLKKHIITDVGLLHHESKSYGLLNCKKTPSPFKRSDSSADFISSISLFGMPMFKIIWSLEGPR